MGSVRSLIGSMGMLDDCHHPSDGTPHIGKKRRRLATVRSAIPKRWFVRPQPQPAADAHKRCLSCERPAAGSWPGGYVAGATGRGDATSARERDSGERRATWAGTSASPCRIAAGRLPTRRRRSGDGRHRRFAWLIPLVRLYCTPAVVLRDDHGAAASRLPLGRLTQGGF